MALITCPECGKEISDKAAVCPNCGCPMQKSEQTEDNEEKRNNRKKITSRTICIVIVAVIVISVAVFFIFGASNSIPITHKGLGYSISIGMGKEDIDDMLNPKFDVLPGEGDFYMYEEGINITYESGKVKDILVSSPQWETENGIHIGSSVSDVFNAYGESEIVDISKLMESVDSDIVLGEGFYIHYNFDRFGNVCDLNKRKFGLHFDLDNMKNEVVEIYVSN